MGVHTGLILFNIFIICIVSITIVKLYYRKHADADVDINLFGSYSFFTNKTTKDTDKIILQSERNKAHVKASPYYNQSNGNRPYVGNSRYNNPRQPQNKPNPYAMTNNNNYNHYNSNHRKEGDRMSQNNDTIGKMEKTDIAKKIENQEKDKLITNDQSTQKETYTEIKDAQPKAKDQELKDLFTIDELIKESKRKSSPKKDESGSAIEEDIKKDIPTFLTDEERESMKDHVDEMEEELNQRAVARELKKRNEEILNESSNDVYTHTQSPINSPFLKSPTKTDKSIDSVIKDTVEQKIEEMPREIDQSTQKETYDEIYNETYEATPDQPLNDEFEQATEVEITDDDDFNLVTEDEEEYNDLDYRKDIARITNKVKNSRLFNDVKNKLKVEEVEEDNPSIDEEFLRNVRSYDAPEPDVITPETREFDGFDSPYIQPEFEKPKMETKADIAKKLHIEQPKREVLDLKINNNPAKLKKGDEIIFKYHGDSYSSKVLRINGDDISVKFRGQYITIKPSDVKKIF